MQKALADAGQPTGMITDEVNVSCRGIGGETKGSSKWTFPSVLFGYNGGISSLEVPDDIPMLVSYELQGRLDVHHHTRDQTIDIGELDIYGAEVIRTKRGHPALSLLEFDGVHPGVQTKVQKLVDEDGFES